MDFALPEHSISIRDEIKEFAERELSQDVRARDSASEFWLEGWNLCGELGIQGLPVPKAYGGRGCDLTTTIAVLEALGYACSDKGLIFAMNAHLWAAVLPILTFGTEEQKQKWLPGLCNGKLIGANAASEPEAGSDIFSMKTSAVRDNDHFVVNGKKTFVGNSPVADILVAYGVTKPNAGNFGISAFLIDPKSPGVIHERELEKMGLRTCLMGELSFENCRVPAVNLLGSEGAGATVFGHSMEWERGCILAMHLGIMQRQLERCIERAKSRVQFNRPVGQFQSVANRIADMKVRLDAARPMIYKIGWLKDQKKSAVMEAAVAKIFVSEAAVQSSLDAIQIFGGYGYLSEYGVERDLRDAIGGKLYSGTVEIQRNIVARMLGLPSSTN